MKKQDQTLSNEALRNRANESLKVGQLEAALKDLYEALRQEPRNLEVRNQIRFVHRKLVPTWHFHMMNDSVRNFAYEKAIAKVVKPGMTVFEIGTGSGLLSMFAARAGAAHVWSCEKTAPIRNVAREIIKKNGFSQKITLIDKWSTNVQIPKDIPDKVDVIIAEIFGAGLLEEQAVHFFNDARVRLLKPGGAMIPYCAVMSAVLIESPSIFERAIVGQVSGLDLKLFNGLHDDPALQVNLNTVDYRELSEHIQLQSLNFRESILPEEEFQVKIPVKKSGTCHGVAMWFQLDLSDGISINTSPTSLHTHWDQSVQVFEKPFEIKEGQVETFVVRRFSDRFSLNIR